MKTVLIWKEWKKLQIFVNIFYIWLYMAGFTSLFPLSFNKVKKGFNKMIKDLWVALSINTILMTPFELSDLVIREVTKILIEWTITHSINLFSPPSKLSSPMPTQSYFIGPPSKLFRPLNQLFRVGHIFMLIWDTKY